MQEVLGNLLNCRCLEKWSLGHTRHIPVENIQLILVLEIVGYFNIG